MIPSTTRRLSPNGCPRRPAFEGSNGSIRAHCSSPMYRNRETVVTRPESRKAVPIYGRHALGDAFGPLQKSHRSISSGATERSTGSARSAAQRPSRSQYLA